jgi:hypothetical protein
MFDYTSAVLEDQCSPKQKQLYKSLSKPKGLLVYYSDKADEFPFLAMTEDYEMLLRERSPICMSSFLANWYYCL